MRLKKIYLNDGRDYCLTTKSLNANSERTIRVIVSAEVLVAMTPNENEEREFVAVSETGRILIMRICFREMNIEFSSITLVHELR